MKFRTIALSSIVLAATASHSLADEIIFNNGDKLTGTIETTEDGKITINTTVAGEVKVDLKDVKTFTSDNPVTLKMKDGSVIQDKVTATTQPGFVDTNGTGSVATQPVPLSKVDAVNPTPVGWHGSLAAGGLLTRGNSDTEAFNANFDATRRSDTDRINASAQYLFGRQKNPATGVESETTNDGYILGKYDYFFTEKFYGYGEMRAERDRIADLDLRLTPGVGVGYQWVERPTLNFDTEAGVSYVYENYTTTGENKYVSGRLAYHVDTAINDRLKLFNDLEFFPSFQSIGDFYTNESAGARFMLTKNWFTEIKQEWRYDSMPAPGAHKNDLRYVLDVGWTF